MTEKDPAKRLTAAEALDHPWFHMEHKDKSALSSAYDNMQKHNSSMRFNMEKMKPAFGLVTCSPVMSGASSGSRDSPLISSANASGTDLAVQSPKSTQDVRPKEEEEKKRKFRSGVEIRGFARRDKKIRKLSSFHFEYERLKALEGSEEGTDYDDKDMNENNSPEAPSGIEAVHHSLVPRIFLNRNGPMVKGIREAMAVSYLRSIGTPTPTRRVLRQSREELKESRSTTKCVLAPVRTTRLVKSGRLAPPAETAPDEQSRVHPQRIELGAGLTKTDESPGQFSTTPSDAATDKDKGDRSAVEVVVPNKGE